MEAFAQRIEPRHRLAGRQEIQQMELQIGVGSKGDEETSPLVVRVDESWLLYSETRRRYQCTVPDSLTWLSLIALY